MIKWYATWCDGRHVDEFDKDGKETVFSKESVPKEGLCKLGLNIEHDGIEETYYFEMSHGRAWLRGVPVWLSVWLGAKRAIQVTARKDVIYEPFQYKEGYIDFSGGEFGVPKPTNTTSHNIGWKAKMDMLGKMYMVKATISIDANTFEPTLSVAAYEIGGEK